MPAVDLLARSMTRQTKHAAHPAAHHSKQRLGRARRQIFNRNEKHGAYLGGMLGRCVGGMQKQMRVTVRGGCRQLSWSGVLSWSYNKQVWRIASVFLFNYIAGFPHAQLSFLSDPLSPFIVPVRRVLKLALNTLQKAIQPHTRALSALSTIPLHY
jgi:hypothetical protein